MKASNSGRKVNKYYSPMELGITLDKYNTVEECYRAAILVNNLSVKRMMRKPTARQLIQKLYSKAYKLSNDASETT